MISLSLVFSPSDIIMFSVTWHEESSIIDMKVNIAKILFMV